jgi:biotin carboxyl carrier protein
MRYYTTVNERQYIIEIDHDGQIVVDGQPYNVNFERLAEGGLISLLLNNRSLEAVVEERDEEWEVLIHGELYTVRVQDERAYRLAKARGAAHIVTGDVTIESPMPGLIVAVPVVAGQAVKKGDKIVILESMKMENELRSPRDGVVTHVYVRPGAATEKGQHLVTIGDAKGGHE